MWEGIYVMSPTANLRTSVLRAGTDLRLSRIVDLDRGGRDVLPGLNVSDRVKGWHKNYRIPDVAVYLAGNPARNCGTHMCGGPDFAVEILSEGDLARSKLDFYAKVNTRELLLLDRDPWALELYRLTEGRLELVGISTPDKAEVLTSQVMPLTFRLVQGQDRPTLELCRLDGDQAWRI